MESMITLNQAETATNQILKAFDVSGIETKLNDINTTLQSVNTCEKCDTLEALINLETDRAKAVEAALSAKINTLAGGGTITPDPDNPDDPSVPSFGEKQHFAFIYQNGEANPESIISYPAGCDNANFTPAKMNYETDKFEYGSWEGAFFLQYLKVVMLNYDGTVAYEINKNDYSKKVNGANIGEEGNVMVGIPKIYIKIVDNGNATATIHVANYKVDSDYECYAHHDKNGSEKDYLYVAAYASWNDSNGKARSLSGKRPTTNTTAQQEIEAAAKNDPDPNDNHWFTSVVAYHQLLLILAYLMGKSTNSQEVFGYGINNRTWDGSTFYGDDSGLMDQKGIFYGKNDNISGIKFLGIENPWGNIWQRCAGWMMVNGQEKIKLTYGKEDGSTVEGFNLTGEGYIDTPNKSTKTSSYSGYTMNTAFTKYGLFPDCNSAGDGSDTTGLTDYAYYDPTSIRYAFRSGFWNRGARVGVSVLNLSDAPSDSYLTFGFSLLYL